MLNSLPVVAAKPAKKIQIASESWTKVQALRQCELTARQLQAWERQGLIAPKEQYAFEDLLELRVLSRLKELGVSTTKLLPLAMHPINRSSNDSASPLFCAARYGAKTAALRPVPPTSARPADARDLLDCR